jgi:hypothetical protein
MQVFRGARGFIFCFPGSGSSHEDGLLDYLSGSAVTRIVRHRSSSILGRTALAGSRLHCKLHFVHHCTAENGCERRVGSISTLSNSHEARLWSQACRVEQNPASPKKSFDIGVKVRRIEAIGICAHEPSWDSQGAAKGNCEMREIPADTG